MPKQTRLRPFSKAKTMLLLSLLLTTVVAVTLSLTVMTVQKATQLASDASTQSSLSFPADHAEHKDYRAEWWYFNTVQTVTDDAGNTEEIGYLMSFSRIDNNYGLLTSRYNNKTKEFDETTHIGSMTATQNNNRLKLEFSGQFVENGITKTANLIFDQKTDSTFTLTGSSSELGQLDLKLATNSFNSPLLWGCTGKISVFSANDTNYYSVPNLVTTGTIKDIDGKNKTVQSGTTWMDHQYFNQSPTGDWLGHYWLSGHLDNGEHYGFVTQLFNNGFKNTYWVKYSPNSGNSCGTDGEVIATASSNNDYPNSLKLQIPSQKLDIVLTSKSTKQIFIPPVGPQFYEPVAAISGTSNNRNVTGVGFFETHLQGTVIPNEYQNRSAKWIGSTNEMPNKLGFFRSYDLVMLSENTLRQTVVASDGKKLLYRTLSDFKQTTKGWATISTWTESVDLPQTSNGIISSYDSVIFPDKQVKETAISGDGKEMFIRYTSARGTKGKWINRKAMDYPEGKQAISAVDHLVVRTQNGIELILSMLPRGSNVISYRKFSWDSSKKTWTPILNENDSVWTNVGLPDSGPMVLPSATMIIGFDAEILPDGYIKYSALAEDGLTLYVKYEKARAN